MDKLLGIGTGGVTGRHGCDGRVGGPRRTTRSLCVGAFEVGSQFWLRTGTARRVYCKRKFQQRVPSIFEMVVC
jgi:hypothetical protein